MSPVNRVYSPKPTDANQTAQPPGSLLKKSGDSLCRPTGNIEVSITFSPDLRPLLHPTLRSLQSITRQPERKTSVKDLVESLRIPHTEIGNLTVNGIEVDFSYRCKDGDAIRAISHASGLDPCLPDLLRPQPLPEIRFLVDVNVTKLGTLLRMTGFDCLCRPRLDDTGLAEAAVREGRILLSRDRNLLKRKIVMHGHLVRNTIPERQLAEILTLYGLHNRIHPFTRCLKCNTRLEPIAKEEVLHRLLPLTKKYYHSFFYCHGCNSIYWPGSHRSEMDGILQRIRQQHD